MTKPITSLYDAKLRIEKLEGQLAKTQATITALREALDKAAHALEITADFIADDMGKETGTAQGIRHDADQARQTLAATEPRTCTCDRWTPDKTAVGGAKWGDNPTCPIHGNPKEPSHD